MFDDILRGFPGNLGETHKVKWVQGLEEEIVEKIPSYHRREQTSQHDRPDKVRIKLIQRGVWQVSQSVCRTDSNLLRWQEHKMTTIDHIRDLWLVSHLTWGRLTIIREDWKITNIIRCWCVREGKLSPQMHSWLIKNTFPSHSNRLSLLILQRN